MGKKNSSATAAAENVSLHKMLKKKIDQLESEQGSKCQEEIRADEAYKAVTSELRTLVSTSEISAEAKVRALHFKLLQKVSKARALETELSRERRRAQQFEREQDSMNAELAKMTSARVKLEALSRELSRQNKSIAEESEKRMEEEQATREQIVASFHKNMEEIKSKLEVQSDSRKRQEEEIKALKLKLRDLSAKYEVREEHFGSQLRMKDLEVELQEAKQRETEEAMERLKEEARQMGTIADAQNKTEASLRAQLSEYGDKFDKFQETLDQSNQVFSAYTTEMEKMSKTVKQLQKSNAALREENTALNKKHSSSTYQLVSLKSELEATAKAEKQEREKKEKLEKLCRGLTLERASLQKETDALQRAWHALKSDIEALRDQSDEERKGDRLWEVLQSLL